MTTTRWMIAAFWAVMIVIGLTYAVESILAPPPKVVPEKHWFPAPLPSANAASSASADVRMTHYIESSAGISTFNVEVTLKNFGRKKATGVQIKIFPYTVGSDTNVEPHVHGPDEMPLTHGQGDILQTAFQYITFPDIAPGDSSTQTVSLPNRSDADPSDSQPKPEIQFSNAP